MGRQVPAEERVEQEGIGDDGPVRVDVAVPRWRVLLVAAGMVLLVGFAGFMVVREEMRQATRAAEAEMRAISHLKASQISSWYAERRADADTVAASPMIATTVRNFISGDGQAGRDLRAWMGVQQVSNRYREVALLDADGHVLLTTLAPPSRVDSSADPLFRRSLGSLKPTFSGLHLGDSSTADKHGAHLDIYGPVRASASSDAPVIAVWHWQIDPHTFLYPLIQSWPLPSATAETLLVERQGDEIVFVNGLRHSRNAPFELKLPVAKESLPAAAAARGVQGVIEGVDYRGVAVLASVGPVPQTPWFIVAKVDLDEVFAAARRQVWLGAMLVLVLAISAGLVVGLSWMRRDRRLLRGQLELERERQALAVRVGEERERYLVTLRSIGDGVVATDAQGNVTLLNDVAERLTGWSREEALGRPIGQVFHIVNEVTRQPCENPVEKVLETGCTIGLANHTALIARDGTERSIADSGAPILADGGAIIGVVLVFRDVTEQRSIDDERENTLGLLRKVNDSPDLAHLLRECSSYLQDLAGCDAVAIRIQEGDDYPYAVTRGFPDEFVQAERCLRPGRPAPARGGDGACLDCWCGTVISGTAPPSHPLFTAKGTFRCGTAVAARAADHPGGAGRVRARCQAAGYESVTLLPLQADNTTLGLLQFNDHRPDFFSPATIEMLERLAASLAIAVSQRRLQGELEASEGRFRLATVNAPFPIMIHAGDGAVLEVNEAWTRLSGYGRDAIATVQDWMRSALGEGVSTPVPDGSETGAFPDGEFEIRTRSGDLRAWSFSSASLGSLSDGRPSFITVATDVTGQREEEARMRQSEKLESIGLLAGGVAHDFNNQLAAIQGYADLLASALGDPRLRGYAENIMRASHRSADLTRELLVFARKGTFNPGPTDVHPLVRDVASLLERSLSTQVQVTLCLDATRSLVNGDASLLQGALLNLAINARDAMPRGGEIRFSTSVCDVPEEGDDDLGPGTYLQLCVADTGTGMSDDVVRQVFQPFFTTKELGRGTGLGLAAVYGTVKRHGGAIRVKSEIAHGTTFTIYLPSLQGEEVAPGQESPAPPRDVQGTATRKSIVVVDDEDLVRSYVADLLRAQGYDVITCANGREAVNLYRQSWRHVDLVILDSVMPVMGGRDAFRAMRAINPHLVALLCSGYSRENYECTTLDDGIVDFLAKPFEAGRLLERVNAALALATQH